MISNDQIAVVAYHVWEAAGRPEGRALDHWLEAEAKLSETQDSATKPPTTPESPAGSSDSSLGTSNFAVTVTSSLACLGTAIRFISAELDRKGEFVPEAFRLTLESWDLADFNAIFNGWRGERLNNTIVEGKLTNGRNVAIRLGPNTKVQPQGGRTIRLEFVVQDYTVYSTQSVGKEAKFRFRVTNLRIKPHGDEYTETIASQNSNPRRTLNKIRFNFAGREWSLSDDVFDDWKDLSETEKSQVLLTGTLSTLSGIADQLVEDAELFRVADDVTYLLSFALARDIKWVTAFCSTPENTIIKEFSRFLCLSTYEMGGFPPLGNWTCGQLKGFLEAAYVRYSVDREWWHRTLNLFSHVFDTRAVDLRAIILNIVLDRASTWILRAKGIDNLIEAGLNTKLDAVEFKQKLQALLASLTAKWPTQRTDAVVTMIKQWNSSPSFPRKIAMAYQEVQLQPPSGLSNRHPLLHIGDPPSDGTIFEYSLELECRVLMLLLRLLNYDGQFFHPFFRKATTLKEHLVNQKRPTS